MTQQNNPLSAEEARELLARAEGIGSTATSAAGGWPAAMMFNSMAILGSMFMIGLHIATHTGYGAALLSISFGLLFAANATIWPLMQRSTKIGFAKRYNTSLFAYLGAYTIALLGGMFLFPNGSLAYYITAAVILAGVGFAAAMRELRA